VDTAIETLGRLGEPAGEDDASSTTVTRADFFPVSLLAAETTTASSSSFLFGFGRVTEAFGLSVCRLDADARGVRRVRDVAGARGAPTERIRAESQSEVKRRQQRVQIQLNTNKI
jgi:hypothetical protein